LLLTKGGNHMARILVVDDSKFIAQILKQALESGGHEVVAVGSDGVEGFEFFKEHTPDLTLLDITMPNRDGRDCLEDILKHDAQARVIMISAIKEQEVIDYCLNIGAKGFLNKPISFTKEESVQAFYNTIDNGLN
jgi:two-component system, chemotaxis family, chemotaxis protein CheY